MTLPTPSQLEVNSKLYWFETLPPGDDIFSFPACPETMTTGQQLYSTGVEQYTTSYSLPLYYDWGEYKEAGSTEQLTALSSTRGFMAFANSTIGTTEDAYWTVSAANARTGSRHLRYRAIASDTGNAQGIPTLPSVAAIGLRKCPNYDDLVTCRITSGEVLTVSVYHDWSDTGVAVAGPDAWALRTVYYTSGLSAISATTLGTTAAPTAYTQITSVTTAPANSAYALAYYQPMTPSTGTDVDLDDWSAAIT